MSYSGGLREGYAELMMFNGIPLYGGCGVLTGFHHRCKLRPHGRGAGTVTHLSILSYKGPIGGWYAWGDGKIKSTRAKAAAAAWKQHADNLMAEDMMAYAYRIREET